MKQNEEKDSLTFLDTFTVDEFKEKYHCEKLPVKTSAKGNLYFRFGHKPGQIGAVSREGMFENPLISRVKGKDKETGKPKEFWLLHEGDLNEEVTVY